MDGVSSPTIESLTPPLPGQIIIPPGVLICGTSGDIGKDGLPIKRPPWAKNGSFLAYRLLNQLVPEFNKFLADNPICYPKELGSELLGARLVGRWKSGAPIELTPLKDDPELGKDEKRNNSFSFDGESQTDQTKCPFAAHIRKTNPRDDLKQ